MANTGATVSVVIDQQFLSKLHSKGTPDNGNIVVPVSLGCTDYNSLSHSSSGSGSSQCKTVVRSSRDNAPVYPSTAVVVPHDCSQEELNRLLADLAEKHTAKSVKPCAKRSRRPGAGSSKKGLDRLKKLVVSWDPPADCWCEPCGKMYAGTCPDHQKVLIPDEDIPKAFFSCPASLSVKSFKKGSYGIFTKLLVSSRSRFGPLIAPLIPYNQEENCKNNSFTLLTADGAGQIFKVDLEDDKRCNWMKFVRPAKSFEQQNLMVTMLDGQLFFDALRNVPERKELRVWYSKDYAETFGFSLLQVSPVRGKGGFSCFACEFQCETGLELDWHFNEAHELEFGERDSASDKHPSFMLKPARSRKFGTNKKGLKRKIQRREIILLKKPRHPVVRIKRKYLFKGESLARAPVKRLRCNLCGKRFGSSKVAHLHLLSHKLYGNAEHMCQFCGNRFFDVQQLKTHMGRMHKRHSFLECPDCEALFPTKSVLAVHVPIHEKKNVSDSPVKIDETLRQFFQSPPLQQIGGIKAQCPSVFCARKFFSGFALADHVTKAHKLPQNFTNDSSKKKSKEPACVKIGSYSCNVCKKKFSRCDWYEEHLATHGNVADWPYQCQVCFKRYSRPAALASHEKTHSTESYFRCFICCEKSETLMESKKHGLTHKDSIDGKFHCHQCGNVYDTFQAIKSHCRYKHGLKEYSCHICEKKFPRSDKLRLHMLSHSALKPLLCSICGSQFKRSDKLKEHVKKVHAMLDDKQQRACTVRQEATLAQEQEKVAKDNSYNRYAYKCEMCVKGFRRRGSLVTHITNCHPEIEISSVSSLSGLIYRPETLYDCGQCSKNFATATSRKRHHTQCHPDEPPPSESGTEMDASLHRLVGHVVHLPFQCGDCPQQYATRDGLSKHIRREHSNIDFGTFVVSLPTTKALVFSALSPSGLPVLTRRPDFDSNSFGQTTVTNETVHTTGSCSFTPAQSEINLAGITVIPSSNASSSVQQNRSITTQEFEGTQRSETPGTSLSAADTDNPFMGPAIPYASPQTFSNFLSSDNGIARNDVFSTQGTVCTTPSNGGQSVICGTEPIQESMLETYSRPPPLIPIASIGSPSAPFGHFRPPTIGQSLDLNTPLRNGAETPAEMPPRTGFTPDMQNTGELFG